MYLDRVASILARYDEAIIAIFFLNDNGQATMEQLIQALEKEQLKDKEKILVAIDKLIDTCIITKMNRFLSLTEAGKTLAERMLEVSPKRR